MMSVVDILNLRVLYSHCGIQQAHFAKVRHIFPNPFRSRIADNAVYLIFLIATGENKDIEKEDSAKHKRDSLKIPKTRTTHSVCMYLAETNSNFK